MAVSKLSSKPNSKQRKQSYKRLNTDMHLDLFMTVLGRHLYTL